MTSDFCCLSVDDLADGAAQLGLDSDGRLRSPLVGLDLDVNGSPAAAEAAVGRLTGERTCIVVGRSTGRPRPWARRLAEHLSVTVAGSGAVDDQSAVCVDDIDAALDAIALTVARSPMASLALRDLLRLTTQLEEVRDGLVAESFAYSMLLAGDEFRNWRTARQRRTATTPHDDPVLAERDDDVLELRLNRPTRRNSFSREMRDALLEALNLPALDPTITCVRIRGVGPSFCSGGDLDEFGTATDVVVAHQVRTTQAVGLAIDRLGRRVEVVLHGACIGAGIEVPAFARTVLARPDVSIRLPELAMGLVPGAGGTVSLPRRIGRWRTEYLALTGEPISLDTALAWGLVDRTVT